MGHVEYRRDPWCLQQELVGDLKRLCFAVCRQAALANAIRTVKGDDPMLRLLILGCVFAFVTLP
ncbi:MAG: hypothetical protein WB630_20430, partial [Candidatus Acidiferrales bacterium]